MDSDYERFRLKGKLKSKETVLLVRKTFFICLIHKRIG